MTDKKLARQADFDQLVKDIAEDGLHSLEEAVKEAVETFEDGFDLSAIFIYKNNQEMQAKNQIERALRTLENVAAGKESLVNMTFSIQGLMQTVRSCDPRGPVMQGAKRLFEQRKGFHLILSILKEISRLEAEQDEGKPSGEASGEEEDDEEVDDFMHYRGMIIEVLLTLMHGEFSGQKSGYRNVEELVVITEEEAALLASLVDELSVDDRILFGLLELVDLAMKVRANVDILRASSSLAAALDVAAKMHKKKDMVVRRVEMLSERLK